MRELRGWIAAFLVIEAVWIIYLLLAFSAADTLSYEQEWVVESGPFRTTPFVLFPLLSMGLWLAAALARALTILYRTLLRLWPILTM